MLTTTLDLLARLGTWSLPALWTPLAFWTAGALLALAALRGCERSLPPLAHYRARQALLFALPLGLLAAATTDLSLLAAWLAPAAPSPAGGVQVAPLLAAPEAAAAHSSAPAPRLTLMHALGLATTVAGVLAAVRLVRLAADAWALVRFRRSLDVQPPDGLAKRLIEEAGLPRRVRLAWAARPVAPMTFGFVQPIVVLPEALRGEPDALRLALTHELVHVRRGDALLQHAEQFVAALFFAHPLVAVLRRTIARSREQATDAAVLDRSTADTRRYAALLYRFAGAPAPSPRALAMAARPSTLKSRLEAMKNHADTNRRFRHPARLSAALALLTLALAVSLAACSDLAAPVKSDAPTSQTAAPQSEGKEVFIAVENMPKLKGGMASLQKEVTYPALARKAGVEGRVLVQFVVDEEGRVEDAKALTSPDELLSEEALRVVRQAAFTPGRQRGQAVKTEMRLPITFGMAGSEIVTPSDAEAAGIYVVGYPEQDSTSEKEADLYEKAGIEVESEPVTLSGRQGAVGPLQVAGKLAFRELNFSGTTVTGRVVDAKTGKPVAGVNIVSVGTTDGAATHRDGSFAIHAGAPVDSIAASFVGYEHLKARKK